MHSDFTFSVNNYIPDPNAKMMIPYRGSVSTPVMQTLSPERSPPASDPSPSRSSISQPSPSDSGASRGSGRGSVKQDPDPVKPSAIHLQTVFSSQTGEAHPSQQHSAQVWETHKAEIRRLYLEENRPLKEVMSIMRQKGFRATVRMYKSRFDKWGFSKNNSKKDVIAMLQVQRQRNAVGKRTAFHRNGKEVAIDAYLRRKGISQYDLVEPGLAENLPENLRCLTPPPETPKTLHAPGTLSLQELILQCARDLAWNWYTPPDTPLVACAAHYRGDELRCAITDITNADWLFSVGQYERGGAMCESGFQSLHLMFQKPSIYGLVHLLITVLDASNKGVVKEIWRYLAAYSATIRADGPLGRLFQGIWKYMSTHDYDEYWEFIFECTEKLLLIEETHSGLPADTLPRLYPILFIPRAYQYKAAPYRRLQSRCDFARLVQGPMPTAVEELTVFQATELLILGNQTMWQGDRVFELANTVLENTKGIAYNTDFFVYIALTSLAHYHRNQFLTTDDPVARASNHQLSVHYLETIVGVMEGQWDPDMGYLLGELERLEHWYREAGDVAQADAAHVRWKKALEAIPKNFVRGKKGVLH
ncbi:hypothetical protein GGR53DRAFT_49885 [Hypoxylon sp. FL1150]|nr:hypothetical protein GGR53DRAFT_49885 [Hypoxylon sp. FL1150]